MQTNPYRSPTPVEVECKTPTGSATKLLLLLGLVIGIELIAAPMFLALGMLLGPELLLAPHWLAAILIVSPVLATGILFRITPRELLSEPERNPQT